MKFKLIYILIVFLCLNQQSSCAVPLGKQISGWFSPNNKIKLFKQTQFEIRPWKEKPPKNVLSGLKSKMIFKYIMSSIRFSFDRIVHNIQKSPKAQDFALIIADKFISYGLFYLGFNLVTHSLMSSWDKIASHLGTVPGNVGKFSSNSTIHSYLKANTSLSSYEEEILANLVVPSSVSSSMDDIGGLDEVKDSLCDFFQPVSSNTDTYRGQSASTATALLAPTRSALLYGPPGCGKSMLARALCRHLNMPMLSITPSLLLRMYVGETPRLTKALFTLANKIQPCILFIDETDSLFCARTAGVGDHAVDRKVITEFMQLWDELQRDHSEVYILGATNRPQDLDPAIQRRFEHSLLVPCPDYFSRKDVIVKLLREVSLDADFDPDRCARVTEGYTASDLAAVCKTAVLKNIRKYSSRRPLSSSDHNNSSGSSISRNSTAREDGSLFRTEDFEEAVKTVYPTAWAADSYASHTNQDGNSGSGKSSHVSPPHISSAPSHQSLDIISGDVESSLEGAYYPYSPYPYPPHYPPSSGDTFSSSSGDLSSSSLEEEDVDVSDDENEEGWEQ